MCPRLKPPSDRHGVLIRAKGGSSRAGAVPAAAAAPGESAYTNGDASAALAHGRPALHGPESQDPLPGSGRRVGEHEVEGLLLRRIEHVQAHEGWRQHVQARCDR